MSVFAQMFRQRTREARTTRLRLEALEARETPATLSGTAWPKPERVTISFTPDGTNLGGPTSNLVSSLNAKFGSATTWQNQILKAAQQWAQHTNLNFAVVSDNGSAIGSGTNVQGDPNFGDIRIGGYNFGTTTLAQAYLPPPVINYSTAGDIQFNTGQTWNIGSTYDLHTVAMHEFGHALGLYHGAAGSAMDGVYGSALTTLQPDDISGIQSVVGYALTNGITSSGYGGTRDHDAFDAAASNNTSGTAKDLTSLINSTNKTLVVGGLDITSTSDVDWYRFTAPTGSATTMTVKVQSSGLSLLAPKFQLYNSSLGTLGTLAIGSGFQGSTLSRTVSIAAGQTYYLMVDGNTNDAMGTGAYGLSVQFASTVPGAIPPPNTTTAEGSPRVNGGGQAVGFGPETRVNTSVATTQTVSSGASRSLAMAADGDHVVVWSSSHSDGSTPDVYFQRYNAQGVKQGGETLVNTYRFGWQHNPAVTIADDGSFVVVWESLGQDGSGEGIYGQRFNAAGVPQGAEFRVNVSTLYDQRDAVVAMTPTGEFVVCWSEYDGTDGSVLVGRRYGANGTALSGELPIGNFPGGTLSGAALGVDALSNFVVAWASFGQDGSGTGIIAQRFNPSGAKVGSSFQVNTYTHGYQKAPAIAMEANGKFVIVWESNDQDGSLSGIYGQRFDATGTRLGSEFRVNTQTAGNQTHASVAVAAGGNFFVTWDSVGQDVSGTAGVYAQQFTAAGVPQGSEFRVNTTVSGHQASSTMGMNANGHAVIVWSGNGSGDATGVFAQRYMISYGGMNPMEGLHRFDPEGHDHDEHHEEDIYLTVDDAGDWMSQDAGHVEEWGLSQADANQASSVRASVDDLDAVALGTLDELEPVHVYRFVVPAGVRGQLLTVGALALQEGQEAPLLQLFDAGLRPVGVATILDEDGTFAGQASADWVEGTTFFVKAVGRGRRSEGDYCLGVDFTNESLV